MDKDHKKELEQIFTRRPDPDDIAITLRVLKKLPKHEPFRMTDYNFPFGEFEEK